MNFVLSGVLIVFCCTQLITFTHAATPMTGRAGKNSGTKDKLQWRWRETPALKLLIVQLMFF